jgi:hypothetical protein
MTDWNKPTVSDLIYRNAAGGLYHQPGRMYQLPRKTKVAKTYLQLCVTQANTSVNQANRISKVSWKFANLVITELKSIGVIVDPELMQQQKFNMHRPDQILSTLHGKFLLSLMTLNPA